MRRHQPVPAPTRSARPPAVGDLAPDLALRDQNGASVRLSQFAGEKHVLLVFYPFAFSGICTGELSGIRDDLGSFVTDTSEVLAISCDPVFSLRAWADQQGYFFPLLSDFWPHGEVARSYGVLDEKAGMAVRGTFLVGRDGRVVWSGVNEQGQRRDFARVRAEVAALDRV